MNELGLVLGWRTALLGAATLQCLCFAVALWRSRVGRPASGFLSAALVVMAGWIAPYAIGFAGAYDAVRGLTFLPLAAPLAFGPLIYLHAATLASGEAPGQTRLHLVPGLVQWLYFAGCFLLPMPLKWDWFTGGHRHVVAPVLELLTTASLIFYAAITAASVRRLRAAVAAQRSDDDRYAADWLARVLAVLAAGVLLKTGFWLWSLANGQINYFQETGLYLGLGLLGVYLGVEGWRYASLPSPVPRPARDAVDEKPDADWSAAARALSETTRREGWWREPDLSLARLAQLHGMSSARLSRLINLGLDMNLSSFVNGLRADAVAEALRAGRKDDLLDLALEMGFSSKASFNRAFRARFGRSPSAFRNAVQGDPAQGDTLGSA